MKVLVTGGHGYIGGRLCQFLAQSGCFNVRRASRSAMGNCGHNPSITDIVSDWSSDESLRSCSEGVDAIVHLAALNAAGSARDPVAALVTNGVATLRLLEAAREMKVGRFIYVSTAHVYGSPLVGKLTEDTCPLPTHPYATSHRAAEDVVLAADRQGQIEGFVLRLSNAFGAPGAVGANCWDLLFNDLCRQVVLSGRIVLRSTGLQRRDFVPLTDVCSAIFHILQFPGATLDGRLFNIGGEWSPTVFEVANLVADRFELRCGVRPQISRPHPSQGETSQVLDYRIDALRNTGFKASTDRIAELDGLVSFCEAAFGSSRG